MEEKRLDIESKLREYMPSLIDLIGNKPFGWNAINMIVKDNHEQRVTEYNRIQQDSNIADKRLILEANLYDVISSARNGDESAVKLFAYFELLLQDLNRNLPPQQKELLSTTLKGMLSNTDKNYRNFVGELSVLNNCLKSDFALIKLEEKLPNGKKIDFHFRQRGKPYLVEVVNIHHNYTKKYTDEILAAEIKGKLTDKIADKTKDNLDALTFYLVPVIWAYRKDLIRINSLYDKYIKIESNWIFEPLAFSPNVKPDGRMEYKFGKLSTILL